MNFSAERAAFREHLAGRKDAALRERDFWRADQYKFPHLDSPEKHTLEPVLGLGVPLQSLVDNRRAAGKPTNVMELFGSADFLLNPRSADSLTGIRLQDPTYGDPERIVKERWGHHEVIEGDLYDLETRERVSDSFRSRGIGEIDLAVCAPFLGWGTWRQGEFHPSVILDTYYPLLQWTYDTLSRDDGLLVTEIPPKMDLRGSHLRSWEERMNEAGIVTKVAKGMRSSVAAIMKGPDSPDTVVPLQGRCLPPHLQ